MIVARAVYICAQGVETDVGNAAILRCHVRQVLYTVVNSEVDVSSRCTVQI